MREAFKSTMDGTYALKNHPSNCIALQYSNWEFSLGDTAILPIHQGPMALYHHDVFDLVANHSQGFTNNKQVNQGMTISVRLYIKA